MEYATASELREAIAELQLRFHLALARRLGEAPLAESELRQLLEKESSDKQVRIFIIERQKRMARVRAVIARLT